MTDPVLVEVRHPSGDVCGEGEPGRVFKFEDHVLFILKLTSFIILHPIKVTKNQTLV